MCGEEAEGEAVPLHSCPRDRSDSFKGSSYILPICSLNRLCQFMFPQVPVFTMPSFESTRRRILKNPLSVDRQEYFHFSNFIMVLARSRVFIYLYIIVLNILFHMFIVL